MEWRQDTVRLDPKPRGFHLVTDQILEQGPRLDDLRVGLLHVFLQHTSASLTINENAAPTVRGDLERHFNEMVPENQPYYEHTVEGAAFRRVPLTDVKCYRWFYCSTRRSIHTGKWSLTGTSGTRAGSGRQIPESSTRRSADGRT